jgi:hypothetical protein
MPHAAEGPSKSGIETHTKRRKNYFAFHKISISIRYSDHPRW